MLFNISGSSTNAEQCDDHSGCHPPDDSSNHGKGFARIRSVNASASEGAMAGNIRQDDHLHYAAQGAQTPPPTVAYRGHLRNTLQGIKHSRKEFARKNKFFELRS